jgi:Glycosyl transferase family 2
VKVVMTLAVRNEADILGANLAFHLNTGVDFVIATDTGSDDGTTDILDAYARERVLHWIEDASPVFTQRDVVTRMAQLAATQFGADWVINNDADEFWWPRGGSLKEVFASVPARFGAVRGMWRHFVARPGKGFFAERMTVRSCAPVADGMDHAFSPHVKTAHRGDPDVDVDWGNHDAFGRALAPLRGWYPFDVLHFPLRSLDQCEQKYVRRAIDELQTQRRPGPRRMDAYNAYVESRLNEFYDSHVVDDEALADGLERGALALDTRLRDALRALGLNGESNGVDVIRGAPQLRGLGFGDAAIDTGYLQELGTLEELGAVARAQRRLDALEERLLALERGFPARLRIRFARRASQGNREAPGRVDGAASETRR